MRSSRLPALQRSRCGCRCRTCTRSAASAPCPSAESRPAFSNQVRPSSNLFLYNLPRNARKQTLFFQLLCSRNAIGGSLTSYYSRKQPNFMMGYQRAAQKKYALLLNIAEDLRSYRAFDTFDSPSCATISGTCFPHPVHSPKTLNLGLRSSGHQQVEGPTLLHLIIHSFMSCWQLINSSHLFKKTLKSGLLKKTKAKC